MEPRSSKDPGGKFLNITDEHVSGFCIYEMRNLTLRVLRALSTPITEPGHRKSIITVFFFPFSWEQRKYVSLTCPMLRKPKVAAPASLFSLPLRKDLEFDFDPVFRETLKIVFKNKRLIITSIGVSLSTRPLSSLGSPLKSRF